MDKEIKPEPQHFTLLDGIDSPVTKRVLTEPIPYQAPQAVKHRWSDHGGMEIPQAGQDY